MDSREMWVDLIIAITNKGGFRGGARMATAPLCWDFCKDFIRKSLK